MPNQTRNCHQVVTTDTTAEPVQDLMVQLARQGLNTSLRSLQVWTDLARQLGPKVLGTPAGATKVFLASDYDLFKKLLAVESEIVDELVATQRELAQRDLDLRLAP
jgi:hypothetical protein